MNDEIKIPDIDPNDPEAVAKYAVSVLDARKAVNIKLLQVHRSHGYSRLLYHMLR